MTLRLAIIGEAGSTFSSDSLTAWYHVPMRFRMPTASGGNSPVPIGPTFSR
jgi:hypothetical protein